MLSSTLLFKSVIYRMEQEVMKQQRRIDKLLSPMVGKSGIAIMEMRKEVEKSVLVRQLKHQVSTI